MPETLGARLRQRREERGIALAAIAQQTKIKESLLDALENDDVSQWPSSLYRRAFVRAYARAIELDPEAVVQEFLHVHPDPPEIDVIAAMACALDSADGKARRALGLRKVMGSAFDSLSRRPRSTVIDGRGPNPNPGTLGSQAGWTEPAARIATSTAPQPSDIEKKAPETEAVTAATPVAAPPPTELDLLAVAKLCTEFGRVEDMTSVQPLLGEAAKLLDAKGLIVFLWDAPAAQLKPALVHGYPETLVSRLPMVKRDADNPTAAAFRSAETHAFGGDHQVCEALVVPLLTATGCDGVLAIELHRGRVGTPSAVAVATILAAHLAQMPGRGLPEAFAPRVRVAAGGVPHAV